VISPVFAAAIILASCAQNDCSKYVEGAPDFSICDVPASSPEGDAVNDMRRGLFQLYSTDGYGRGIPGVTISIEDAVQSFHVVHISGTTDYATDRKHGFYIRRAGIYASEYNKTVIARESEFRRQ
jgi:hypothetical protein